MTNNNDLRMVAEFMGGPAVEADWEFYECSWDMQISVWSKLCKSKSVDITMEEWFDYAQAVDDDSPAAAFQIIVNILKRMK